MRIYRCDRCATDVEEPICIDYPDPIHDDDGDLICDEAHLCSWNCLAEWAMARALDQPIA